MADGAMHIAWYTPDSWRRLQQVTDAPLADSYEQYVARTEALLRECALQGVTAIKTTIDVDDMARWCRQTGRRNDTKARASYIALETEWHRHDITNDAVAGHG
jgi:hypothetical protein